MAYQTVVAAFDTPAHAQAAVEALKAGGFHADDISLFDKNRVGLREPGLWQRMFGGGLAQHEADVYNQSLERGGMVVSVRVPDTEVAHATGILDIHRPIDVEDRAIRNYDGVALFSDRRHRVDFPVDRDPIDLHQIVRQQFVDQLLALMSDPRDLSTACFHGLL